MNVQLNFFGVCFFHLNVVSKILGEELKATTPGNFIRYFNINSFRFAVIQLVMDGPVAPGVTDLVSQQLTRCVHFVVHSWNLELKIEYLKYFVFQKYNTKYLWEPWKMYNLKNVTYKGSCLPVRVLLPRKFLISLILSGGEKVGLWKWLLKVSLFHRK